MSFNAPPTDSPLALLTGPDVDHLLDAALQPAGGHVLAWSLRDVDHRPGRRTTVTYNAQTDWPEGPRAETFGASIDPRRGPDHRLPDDRLVVSDGTHAIEVWRFPYDPELPALATATIPASAQRALNDLGIAATDVSLRVVSYRPRKRAVIEVTTPRDRLFMKVLRPSTLTDVRSRHELLASAGLPVPPVLANRSDGLLVLGELAGEPLRAAIDSSGPSAPDGSHLVELLDRLPEAVTHLPRRKPWSAHAEHYAGVVSAALPEVAAWARSLGDSIAAHVAGDDPGDEPTHGDFYESQVMVTGDRVTGLLDIDTVGPGRRVDDLGCLLGHLSVLTIMADDGAPPVADAMHRWQRHFDRLVDPHDLRVRAAGVVLSLATGPFRARDDAWEQATATRLALVERWLESAADPRSPTSVRDLGTSG